VRNRGPGSRRGWTRLGLQTSDVATRGSIALERRVDLVPPRRGESAARRFGQTLRSTATRGLARLGGAVDRIEIPVLEFRNARGERMRAIVDRVGERPGAPLVLIPPAWGRTKETVAPLALTILETFRAIGLPITVLRFDGTRRRGESFNDPECLRPGDEHLHFTFSGAVDDIRAALDFAAAHETLKPDSIVVVSSSLASIEARRAIAAADDSRIRGWVSLVGLIDLHTVLRAVSGGVDYGLGALRGVEFGVQELFGVRCDIDRIVGDAIDHGLWFLEDARSDLASIRAPITWFHGSHDAWTALESVRDALSCGDVGGRRLLEIPIGHQLRTSTQALEVFQLVAAEVGRMLTGRSLRARVSERRSLVDRERAERQRLPLPHFDLRRFWRDYLVGRSGEVGMELLTSSEAYRDLLAAQVAALGLREGDRVADLGSGVGDFAVFLRGLEGGPDLSLHAFDYVREALLRQRERLGKGRDRPRVGMALADLGVGEELSLPLRSGSYDAVLASLLLTYLRQPQAFLAEAFRILRPGGRLVVSGVRPDADVSKLYSDSLQELSPDRLEELFGSGVAGSAQRLRRWFLSDASRILDLEEFGYFRFWDDAALERMVGATGFRALQTTRAFGDPPQAIVVGATRP
jgi:ubiquinone/menaquinone biosynthesis C-methylase UbiE